MPSEPWAEALAPRAPIGNLAGDLVHESAESLADYVAKQNRYSTLAAQHAQRNGQRSSAAQVVASPLLRFCKFYLLRGGCLDGAPGLVHCAIGAFASFLKHAKLLAAQRTGATL